MSELMVKKEEMHSNLQENGIGIFIIRDSSKEEMNNFCNRVSEKIDSLVDWQFMADSCVVLAMKCDVKSAVNVGKEIFINEYDTNDISYLKNGVFVPLYNDYTCIASICTQDLEGLKKWCKELSDTMHVVTDIDDVRKIWTKKSDKDTKILKANKDNCTVDFKTFKVR